MDISIGFLSTTDARDPKSWSGTSYFMARALARRVRTLEYLGPFPVRFEKARQRINKIQKRLGAKRTLPGKTFWDAHHNARHIEQRLLTRPCDILVAPAGASLIGAYGGTLPVLYSSDTTYRLMNDYYPSYKGVTPKAGREADQLELAALQRSSLALMPTQWAADSVMNDYGVTSEHVDVVPYGINLEHVPKREDALATRANGPLKLLFVGVNWDRKGGDILIETLQVLRAKHIPVSVTIVGCKPPAGTDLTDVKVMSYLNKSNPDDVAQLAELYLTADILLVPSRQECFGIVFGEAAAHGVPSIAADTGGVSEVVRDGQTGFLLPLDARGADFAEAVLKATYERPGGRAAQDTLRKNARQDYEQRLNWDIWADHTLDRVERLLTARRA